MAGVANEESGAERTFEGASSGQLQLQCQSGETSEEWRFLEQIENGTPSTSLTYWDNDDDEDGEQKPSELYGKHTWKIDKFSQITKRELRSNAFEVGGYKWYILIYPQGCDVCNHLSLFLCVANHDKLLPGWSHLAQFTIAVVNKDPKKSKYSDTLHRFWKKEHDWGWKKFMELPKVIEGFIEADTLIIKAQVQIIRERTDRPFRCLDCPYRRELVRVYLTNVDGLCRRFLEDQRAKLRKLIEDKARWSSFCTFWLGMDQSARQSMSRENAESILKVVVKHFFIEKEVTSTLVMDSLYIGMKALVGQNKGKKSKGKKLEAEQPVPIIHIDEDTFVLVDDVLLLLERASMEPLPPMDEKGPQNRTKDVAAGEEFSKDSIERDERRLAELGRQTIEIFVLAHIFSSKIEVAHQEAVSLMRQEELIREEEAAWLANGEHKIRRGVADKEKKSKKKQGKHKKNNRKVKDKGRDEKLGSDAVLDKTELDSPTVERDDFSDVETETPHEKIEAAEDISDLSDSIDCEPEILPLDSEGIDASPVNWDTDTSKPHHPTKACSNETSSVSAVLNGVEGISLSALDNSSSTCPSDSVPHIVISVPQRANLRHHHNNQTTLSRGRTRQSEVTSKTASHPFEAVPDVGHSTDLSRSCKAVEILSQDTFHTLQDTMDNRTKQHVEKDGGTGYMHRVSCSKDVNMGTSVTSPSRSPSKSIPSMAPLKLESKVNAASDPVMFKNSSTSGPKQVDSSKDVVLSGASGTSLKSPARTPSKIISYAAPSKLESNINAAGNPVMVKSLSTNGPKQADRSNPTENGAASKPETQKVPSQKPTEKPFGHQAPPTHYVPVTTDKPSLPSLPVVSRPLSTPMSPTFKPAAVSTISSVGQTAPTLARPVSATGQLGPEQLTPSYVPHSYHNAIMDSYGSSSAYAHIPRNHSASTRLNLSFPFSNAPALLFSPQNVDRMDLIHPNISHGMVNQPNILQSGPRIWTEQHNTDMQHFDLYAPMHTKPETHLLSQVMPGSSGRQHSHATGDEFPHLDIINDLLDDENVIGNEPMLNSGFQNFNNGPQHMNQQFRFSGESGFSRDLVHSTSSCGFEETRIYHDNGFQNGYSSSTSPYDMVHRASPRPHINGQIDGLIPSQWQMASSESPYPENNSYPYHPMLEYPNLNVGVNGYTVYRPSNGL